MKYCPTCNRSDKEAAFYGEFCEFCTRDRVNGTIKDDVRITRCKRCNQIRTREGFRGYSKDSLRQVLLQNFKGFRPHIEDFDENSIKVTFMSDDAPPIEKNISISYEKMLCENCNRKSGGYYEAIMQLRGDESKIKTLSAALDRHLARSNSSISRIEEVNNGVNIYLIDKGAASGFITARHIKAQKSSTLRGVKNGRRVYSNTYLILL